MSMKEIYRARGSTQEHKHRTGIAFLPPWKGDSEIISLQLDDEHPEAAFLHFWLHRRLDHILSLTPRCCK